jgi:hypothetical protein
MLSTQAKACLSCRQRKLKCDRRQPCANCVSRSVECEEQLLLPANRRHGLKRPLVSTSGSDDSAIPAILERLDRIESYIGTARKSDCDRGKELDTVGNSVSDVTSASQSVTSGVVAPLGHLSANDTILVRVETSQFGQAQVSLTVNRVRP